MNRLSGDALLTKLPESLRVKLRVGRFSIVHDPSDRNLVQKSWKSSKVILIGVRDSHKVQRLYSPPF